MVMNKKQNDDSYETDDYESTQHEHDEHDKQKKTNMTIIMMMHLNK